jgi:hypothetical protein
MWFLKCTDIEPICIFCERRMEVQNFELERVFKYYNYLYYPFLCININFIEEY